MVWWWWIIIIPPLPPYPHFHQLLSQHIDYHIWPHPCSDDAHLGEFSPLCTILTTRAAFRLLFFIFMYRLLYPLPYLTTNPCPVLRTSQAPFQPVYCFYNIISSISHLFCVQPMGLHHPCILNICIVGLCPINFSTCLLLLQVVLRSLSRGPYLLPRKFFKLFTTFANGTQIIVSRAISFLLFAYLFCSHAMRL